MEEFTSKGADPLTVSLYQMDLDRTLFLLRSYLRTRLQKVPLIYVFPCFKTVSGFQCSSRLFLMGKVWALPKMLYFDELLNILCRLKSTCFTSKRLLNCGIGSPDRNKDLLKGKINFASLSDGTLRLG